ARQFVSRHQRQWRICAISADGPTLSHQVAQVARAKRRRSLYGRGSDRVSRRQEGVATSAAWRVRGGDRRRRAWPYRDPGSRGTIDLPTIDMITSEKTIVGNLVGTYAELVELMALADRGLVDLHTKEYRLSEANDALHDLHNGRIHGRAVLIP